MNHAGVQTVMCQLREKYWILRMRKTVREIISKCVICKRQGAKPMRVNPATLPLNRVKDAAAFQITGIDFAGPLYLRGRQKAWICLFTCAVYRAVHLELVTAMSMAAFLDALDKFISRRDRPSVIYSDNGTNFIRANNMFEKLNWNAIAKNSSAKQINWIFNPPTAAWGVNCERTINSRPLTYVSDSSDDLRPLTSAMFLQDLRESECPDVDISRRINFDKAIQHKQELIKHLWERFRKEYLSQLVLKGDVKESRILRPARVAILRTKEGNLKRPLQRIYPLEVESDSMNVENESVTMNEKITPTNAREKECKPKTECDTTDIVGGCEELSPTSYTDICLGRLCITKYNKGMNGIDLQDQILACFPKQCYVDDYRINIAESLLKNMPKPNYRERGELSSGDAPERLHVKHWAHFPKYIDSTASKLRPSKP
ncbi:PREDICTED: uncharacterized protein LOC107073510 [Polistes dominula]|uniref:Uncharacterized protein LOC107073510 n=1 Tax=Polistes dominula TaxID=743375 RepID=A0ABM1JB46_POLDO|nr:PREDICTED: uncharacterized protein LOC107073510 [Polistes dominula]